MKGTMKKKKIVESSFKLFMCMVIMLVSMPGIMWECDTYADIVPSGTIIIQPEHDKMVVGDKITLKAKDGSSPITWGITDGSEYVETSINNNPASTLTITGKSVGKVTITATLGSDTEIISIYIIDGIAMSQNTATINAGKFLKLGAIASNGATLQWSSDNDAIATVDQEGLVKTLKPGKVTITVQQLVNGVVKSATCDVTVLQGVEGISLYVESNTLYKDDQMTFVRCNFINSSTNPANKKIKWRSSDPSIAYIKEGGDDTTATVMVSERERLEEGGSTWSSDDTKLGYKAGTVIITALSEDGNYSASVSLDVRDTIDEIILETTSLTVNLADQMYQLTATIKPEGDAAINKELIWKSSDDNIATVSQTGLVTFKKSGNVTISVTPNETGNEVTEKVIALCNIYIKVPVKDIKLDKTKNTLNVGEEFRLTHELVPADATNKKVTWESTDPSVATVSDKGDVKAIAGGKATIVVRTEDGGIPATCEVTVLQSVENIKLNATNISLSVGDSKLLKTTITPVTANKNIIWESDNPSVVSVDEEGEVTAHKTGEPVLITARDTLTGVTASCVVKVTQPATGLVLSHKSKTLYKGNKFTITKQVYPVGTVTNDKVTWSSTNPKVATVNSNGTVTAKAGGTAIIVCKTVDRNIVKMCTVTVKEYVSKITINRSSLTLKKGKYYTFTKKVYNTTATNKKVVWTTSNSKVVRVYQNGRIKALKKGTAYIRVKARDGSGKYATCKVTVKN